LADDELDINDFVSVQLVPVLMNVVYRNVHRATSELSMITIVPSFQISKSYHNGLLNDATETCATR